MTRERPIEIPASLPPGPLRDGWAGIVRAVRLAAESKAALPPVPPLSPLRSGGDAPRRRGVRRRAVLGERRTGPARHPNAPGERPAMMLLMVTRTAQRIPPDDGLRFALYPEPPRMDGDLMRGVRVEWLGPLPAGIEGLKAAEAWWRMAAQSATLPPDMRHQAPPQKEPARRQLGWWKAKLFPELFDAEGRRR